MNKSNRTTIAVDVDLLEKARQHIEGTTYQSVPKLVTHILEMLVNGDLIIETTVRFKDND